MSLADYLAKNYLNPADSSESDKKKKKKKKKEKQTSTSDHGVVTADVTGWEDQTPQAEEEDTPITNLDEDDTLPDPTFVSKKAAGWKKLGSSKVEPKLQPPLMESGAKAGLQTAAEVEADIARKEAEELRKLNEDEESMGRNSETVYRDVTGRQIDIQTQIEQEKVRLEEEKRQKEREKRKLNMGLVQQAEAEREAQKLNEIKHASIARYADDEELNEYQKAQNRIEDPAAKFLTKKSKSRSSRRRDKNNSPERKTYQGHYQPNRFNIPPGPLWDGVDRSNGFESKWFKRQNELKEKNQLTYTMSYDI